MQSSALYQIVKIVGTAVLVLMVAAIGYASAVGLTYWSGIGV